MKIKINSKTSHRVVKRFKWLSLAAVAVLGLNYMMNSGYDAMEQTLFVEAGADKTLE